MNFFRLKIFDALTVFLALVIEAIPFILLGVFLSALLSRYLSAERLVRFFPRNRFGAMLAATGLGFLFPVCECGNVPVARRLMQKKVPPWVTIVYLLSAPVFNPLVILSTWSAFRFWPEIVWLRILLSLLVAFLVGTFLSFHPQQESLIQKKYFDEEHGTCGVDGHDCEKPKTFLETITGEFFEMMKYLLVGAFFASMIQLVIPRTFILQLGNEAVFSILTMMILAMVTSVCSNVDAFIALSYSASFSGASLLSFLVLGPIFDLKSIFLLRRLYTNQALLLIFSLSVVLIFLFTILLQIFFL